MTRGNPPYQQQPMHAPQHGAQSGSPLGNNTPPVSQATNQYAQPHQGQHQAGNPLRQNMNLGGQRPHTNQYHQPVGGHQQQGNSMNALRQVPTLPQERTPPPNASGAKLRASQDILKSDRKSSQRIRLMAIAFLIFYVLIVASQLIVDYRSAQSAAQSEHLSFSQAVAANIAKELENANIWIDNGLAEGQTPGQSARIIAKSPMISAAAILNSENELIARYPARTSVLNSIPKQSSTSLALGVNSIVQEGGEITPIIIRPTGNYFIVIALEKDALIDDNATALDKVAVVAANGRVIAATSTVDAVGPREAFNLNELEFANLTQSGTNTTITTKINNSNHLLGAVSIPETELFLLNAKPKKSTGVLQNNLLLFTILFLGTSALILTLLKSLKKQIRVVQGVQQDTEISQQRYQAAVEGDRGGVWEIDLAGSEALISASLSGVLGLLRQEQTMALSKFLGLFHPEDRDKFLAFARRAHLQGEFDFDIRVANRPLILQCRGRSSTRSGAEMKRVIVGVALDITEQRMAQIQLKSTEARLHNALSSMTDSFVVWDHMKNLVVWNNRFEQFFNLAPGQLQMGMDHAAVDFVASPSVAERIEHESGNERWTEYHLNNGRWIRYIETQTVEGGHVSIGTDITELRLREADLKENENALTNTVSVLRKSQDSIVELAARYESEKIRAEEASQSKSNFLASMSHELRTPLNAINGFSDIMNKEMFGPLGDPRYKEYVKDILFSGQHLLSLINDILDMSKIEAGKMTLNTEVMFIHEMVEQVVRMIRGRADDANLKLNVDVAEVKEIEADPRSVKQVLLNLLTNAVKFTPENGAVGIELIQKTTGIIVKVSDTGIGISQENIEKLAKPFEQVDDDAKKQAEGTGLGLALSKSLVELHGGNFKIESVVGEGTTVIFSLPNKPIKPAQKDPSQDVSSDVTKITADITNILDQTETALTHDEPAVAVQASEAVQEQVPAPYEPVPYQAAESIPVASPYGNQPSEDAA